jgi:hypothetical protein
MCHGKKERRRRRITIIIIITRNGAKIISLQTLFGRLKNVIHSLWFYPIRYPTNDLPHSR